MSCRLTTVLGSVRVSGASGSTGTPSSPGETRFKSRAVRSTTSDLGPFFGGEVGVGCDSAVANDLLTPARRSQLDLADGRLTDGHEPRSCPGLGDDRRNVDRSGM